MYGEELRRGSSTILVLIGLSDLYLTSSALGALG